MARDPLGEAGICALGFKLGSFCIIKWMGGWVNEWVGEEICDFLFPIIDLRVSNLCFILFPPWFIHITSYSV